MKRKLINENQVRTILSVFGELERLPYDELNKYLGNITIEEMIGLRKILNDWYQPNVNGKIFNEEMGWIDECTDFYECTEN